MTRWQQGPRFVPSPQGIALVRERLQRLGLPVTEAMVPTAAIHDRPPVAPRRPPELPDQP